VRPSDVSEMELRLASPEVSLDATPRNDRPHAASNVVPADPAARPDQQLERTEFHRRLKEQWQAAISLQQALLNKSVLRKRNWLPLGGPRLGKIRIHRNFENTSSSEPACVPITSLRLIDFSF